MDSMKLKRISISATTGKPINIDATGTVWSGPVGFEPEVAELKQTLPTTINTRIATR